MKQICAPLLLAGALLAAEEFPTSAGPVRITPIQHASLIIEAGGQVIYLDPSQGKYEGLPPGDMILLTDIHGDHLAPAVLAKVRKPQAVIFAPAAAVEQIPGATVIRNGETKTWGKWKIEAIPAYNLSPDPKSGRIYHEKGRGNGYVLTYGGKRFYFSGDTEGIPEMKALKNIDAAFVCMNLPYTMTPQAAAEAVRAFRPKVVYPYHYRGSDLQVFEKALAGSGVEVRLRDWYKQ